MRRFALPSVLFAFALASASGASAHNAGYVIVNGECQAVGSGLEAPLVPTANPNRNATTGQLDLIPGSGDQYGARFAAVQGQSAVYPPYSSTQTCPPWLPAH